MNADGGRLAGVTGVNTLFQDPDGLNGFNVNGVPVTTILINNALAMRDDRRLIARSAAATGNDPSSFQRIGLDSNPDRVGRRLFGFNYFRISSEETAPISPSNQRRAMVINGSTGELLLNIQPIGNDGGGVAIARQENQAIIDAINSVSLAPPPNPFEVWADEQGIPADVRGDTDDPDGDQLNNLLEYALGLNPTEGDAVNVLPQVRNENGLQFAFQRRQDNEIGTLEIQMSPDLDFSNPISPADGEVQVQDMGNGLEWVTVNMPAGVERLFFRVSAERTP